jgi:isoquinoline 1-oxidoreductase subunit beta
MAMVIAEEMDIPVSRVHVSLSKARPELQFNQLTGGSNSTRSLYPPLRRAAAVARKRLVDTAADQWGVAASTLTVADGVIRSKKGHSATYGSLTQAAAASLTTSSPAASSSRWTTTFRARCPRWSADHRRSGARSSESATAPPF